MSKPPVPLIDPDHWHAHPAWASQAYDALVGFHDRYRREVSRLVAAAQDPGVGLAELRAAGATLREHLHNHEAVEEQGLYPWIEAHHDVDLDGLRAEHAELNHRLDRVLTRLADDGADRTGLRAALVALEDHLRAHLVAEEAVCVPVLLAMSPAAYARLLAGR